MPETRDHTQRLGRVMPYESGDGTMHPESFWCQNFAGFDIGDSKARLEFIGFSSIENYNKGARQIDGAKREYHISPDVWLETVFMPLPAPDQPFAVNFLLAGWSVALKAKEVGEPPVPTEDDPEPDDTRVSFFADSTPAV